jgi:hypothetical protein
MNNTDRYPIHILWSNAQIKEWQDEVIAALTPHKLAAWFQLRHDDVVGHARQQWRCPVKNYLNDVLPYLDCEVGWHYIRTPFSLLKLFKTGPYKGLIIEDLYYTGLAIDSPEMPSKLTELLNEIDEKYCYQTPLGQKIKKDEVKKLYTECDFPVTGGQALALVRQVYSEELHSTSYVTRSFVRKDVGANGAQLSDQDCDRIIAEVLRLDEEKSFAHTGVYWIANRLAADGHIHPSFEAKAS